MLSKITDAVKKQARYTKAQEAIWELKKKARK